MGDGEKRSYSGSEDFAKSLEPSFKPYHEREAHVVHKLHSAAAKPRKPSLGDQFKSALKKPVITTSKVTIHHPPPQPSPHAHHRRKRFELFAAFYLLLLLAGVMFLAASTDSGPFVVLLSFTPTLFTIIVAMIIYEAHRDNKHVLWAVPIVLIFAFNWYGRTAGGFFGTIDVDALTGLNVLAAFLYLIINYFLLQSKAPKAAGKVKVVEREVVKEVIPEDLSKFIASVEDKGKALNFVVGRVYNAYHGGSKLLREKVNMRQEWYDQFSQIPADPAKVDFVVLKELISLIEKRLHLLEKSEAEVFGLEHKNFKNLVRKDDGSERVIDVLDKNDKDPVKSYVEGALQFCGKVQEFIAKRQAPEVKNKYVPREDEEKQAAPRSSWSGESVLKK